MIQSYKQMNFAKLKSYFPATDAAKHAYLFYFILQMLLYFSCSILGVEVHPLILQMLYFSYSWCRGTSLGFLY